MLTDLQVRRTGSFSQKTLTKYEIDYMKILVTIKDFECITKKLSINVQAQVVSLGNSTKRLKKDHTSSRRQKRQEHSQFVLYCWCYSDTKPDSDSKKIKRETTDQYPHKC